ncbi:unnamed protein product [Clonostachys rosea f. rosea IK726]|uniref:Uncharacterized protein n=2 Tax=Bionectria ochroleuca TaxID=29856 RepID=A0A0B7JX47_BIOOC|nr:unnamed protein product [Clonostachys rosea f. rosea IK726]
METINNVASAAAKAILGEGNASKEPISGAKGDVTQGEPYDAGNLETPGQQQVEKRLELGDSDLKPSETAAVTTHPSSGGPLERHEEDEKTIEGKEPIEKTSKGKEVTEKTPEAEKDLDESDPPSPNGPGPRPLPVLAKEHNGDAGRIDDDKKSKEKADEAAKVTPDETSDAGSKAPAQEEYVKSTGFAAEGGDFDATKPGAGREADRLLGKGGATHSESDHPEKHSSKSKPSLGERIKAKLHKH